MELLMVYPFGKSRIPGELVGAKLAMQGFAEATTCAILLIGLPFQHFNG
jgi:hypothetical protein